MLPNITGFRNILYLHTSSLSALTKKFDMFVMYLYNLKKKRVEVRIHGPWPLLIPLRLQVFQNCTMLPNTSVPGLIHSVMHKPASNRRSCNVAQCSLRNGMPLNWIDLAGNDTSGVIVLYTT